MNACLWRQILTNYRSASSSLVVVSASCLIPVYATVPCQGKFRNIEWYCLGNLVETRCSQQLQLFKLWSTRLSGINLTRFILNPERSSEIYVFHKDFTKPICRKMGGYINTRSSVPELGSIWPRTSRLKLLRLISCKQNRYEHSMSTLYQSGTQRISTIGLLLEYAKMQALTPN